jgi:ATP-dependent HslUV protease ATP-binding subunit HslU
VSDMTPHEIVEALDKYIVGQTEAKRAVAIALRNRYRRSKLPPEIQDEVTPKNIIMMGPTGVGKTEIARRLAKLVKAPFVKVEATKFTEVGYVGRDCESMVRDLVEDAIWLVKTQEMEKVRGRARAAAEKRLLDAILPLRRKSEGNALGSIFAGMQRPAASETPEEQTERETVRARRQEMLARLRAGELENEYVDIEIEDTHEGTEVIPGMGMELNISEMLGGIIPRKKKRRHVTVQEARRLLEQDEAQKLINMDEVKAKAIEAAEKHGIIFIDEIDKIAGRGTGSGPDVSREGVQRDILPLVEGTTVVTKHGPVKTDYILFIAAGAFHMSKMSDLIPELQGRFPIKVELSSLTVEDFKKILVQPENAITKQYAALLEVDHVRVSFTPDALDAIAEYAYLANETSENIGARRLHTIMENLLEDISFNASGTHPMVDMVLDAEYVRRHLRRIAREKDLGKFIL